MHRDLGALALRGEHFDAVATFLAEQRFDRLALLRGQRTPRLERIDHVRSMMIGDVTTSPRQNRQPHFSS